MARLGAIMAFGFLCGCATQVELSPAVKSGIVSNYRSSQFTPAWWSEDLLNRKVVHRHNLGRRMRKDPERALTELNDVVSRSQQIEDIAALAALTFRYGQKLEHSEPQKSLGLYLVAAEVGYRHLIKNKVSSADQWDLRIRESYNRATAGIVMLMQTLPGGMRTNHLLSACRQSFVIEAKAGNFASDPLYYDCWLSADDWKQKGLQSHYWNDGLGARLIAIRTNRFASQLELHLPDEGIFQHATAVLVFAGETTNDAGAQLASLVLYNPVFNPEVDLSGQRYRLAADYTIPWAMLLSRTRPLLRTGWTGLLHPGETPRPERLYMLSPYSPERIPVIMVHGLWSTPLVWQQLTNELMGDPEIRAHYQFWHYLYPTGFPLLKSAADFREEVEHLRSVLDPDGSDFAMRNMVVVGHSMGGLLARTLVTDSGDAIWNSTFAIPFSDVTLDGERLAELRRLFYFRPRPYVKRVVFMAVPHRGSKTADGLLARIMARRVHLPDHLHAFVSGLVSVPKLLQAEASALFNRGYLNSIRVLSPTSGRLMALAELPVDPSLLFHSIIGDRGRGDGEKSSDGAVPYSSSHLAGASSELIVPSNHRTYENPQALAEIKRILKLHLAQMNQCQTASNRDER